jgi:hypothetical protein
MAELVYPDLPQPALADMAQARGALKHVFLKELPAIPRACPNCAGLGAVWLQFVESGLYKTPPPSVVLAYHDGWYVVENRAYPCSACRDHSTLLRHLWTRSGLETGEQGWRLEFCAGLPGKEIALAFAHDLLAALPRPNGWLIYYGGHGFGKSCLLKSVTAACIRAGVSAHYTLAEQILQRIRDEFGEQASPDADVFSSYAAVQVLAIDEVDRVSTSSWARHPAAPARRPLQPPPAPGDALRHQPAARTPAGRPELPGLAPERRRAEVGGRDLRGGALRDWLYNKKID